VRYVIIADFWPEDYAGGGGSHSGGAELSDQILYELLQNKGEDVAKYKSSEVTRDLIEQEKDSAFIISNFFKIHHFLIEEIQKLKYILYCHDYKFIPHTEPQRYENFIAPKKDLIFVDFFKNAKSVICQSALQEKIYYDNLQISNLVNLSGNLWNNDTLNFIESLSNNEKSKACSVVKSPYIQKGVPEAIKFCIQNGLDYQLIGDKNYKNFLTQLSSNSSLTFWPRVPETCGRVAVEAKMMKVHVYTNELLGAAHEPWFNLEGRELVDLMRQRHQDVCDIISASV
tara:strand:- start:3661 stop:4515 length:855 start_codon:yes stop_codon:yes gene_type:complete